MKKIAALIVLAALLAPVAASPAKAEGWHGRGYWSHGWHNGRYGRWWVVGPTWTYYPYYQRPYYYYPAPVAYPPPPPVYYAAPPAPVPAASFVFSFGGGHRHWR